MKVHCCLCIGINPRGHVIYFLIFVINECFIHFVPVLVIACILVIDFGGLNFRRRLRIFHSCKNSSLVSLKQILLSVVISARYNGFHFQINYFSFPAIFHLYAWYSQIIIDFSVIMLMASWQFCRVLNIRCRENGSFCLYHKEYATFMFGLTSVFSHALLCPAYWHCLKQRSSLPENPSL